MTDPVNFALQGAKLAPEGLQGSSRGSFAGDGRKRADVCIGDVSKDRAAGVPGEGLDPLNFDPRSGQVLGTPAP